MKTLSLTSQQQKDIQLAISYLIENERKSYEEYVAYNFEDLVNEDQNNPSIFSPAFYNRPEIDHIYAIACRVKDATE